MEGASLARRDACAVLPADLRESSGMAVGSPSQVGSPSKVAVTAAAERPFTNVAPQVSSSAEGATSFGATRYQHTCRSVYAIPDKSFLSTLEGEHEGEYTTATSSTRIDQDGLFAIVSTLELCRGCVPAIGLDRPRLGARLLCPRSLAATAPDDAAFARAQAAHTSTGRPSRGRRTNLQEGDALGRRQRRAWLRSDQAPRPL